MTERKIDNQGRIKIPTEVLNCLGIACKDSLKITVEADSIILTPVIPSCKLCGSRVNLIEKGSLIICSSCYNELYK